MYYFTFSASKYKLIDFELYSEKFEYIWLLFSLFDCLFAFFDLVFLFPFFLKVFCGFMHIIYLTLESYYAELSAEGVFYIRTNESVSFPNSIELKTSIRICVILVYFISNHEFFYRFEEILELKLPVYCFTSYNVMLFCSLGVCEKPSLKSEIQFCPQMGYLTK